MESHLYRDLDRGIERNHYFFLNCFLKSRIETNEESTDEEDVNIYLANVLHNFLMD